MPSKGKKPNEFPLTKLVKFSKLPPFQLPSRLFKKFLEKSKFHCKNVSGKKIKQANINKLSYMQISSKNISNILKINKNFPKLSTKKIKELNKLIFNKTNKLKPKINMTTKEPSHKQVIVPISSNNVKKFMSTSGDHVANLNCTLKSIKFNIIVDFI